MFWMDKYIMVEHVLEDCQCEGKRCTKCEEVRCVGQFTKDKHLKSGLKSHCRICAKAYQDARIEHRRDLGRAYYREHADEQKKYKQSRKEWYREYKKSWEKKNIDRIRASRLSRKELANQRRRQHYLENPDSAIARTRAYRQVHPEYNREYAQAHPEIIRLKTAHRRARKKKAEGSYTVEEWELLKVQYKYSCLCCGRKEPEIKLTIDHIVPLTKGGDNTIDNLQPLCYSCNSAKRSKVIDYRTKREANDGIQS